MTLQKEVKNLLDKWHQEAKQTMHDDLNEVIRIVIVGIIFLASFFLFIFL